MHILYDEHGNMIPHGAHGSEQEHSHTDEEAGKKEKAFALLSYMLEHNEHHAKELEEVADNLSAEGFLKAAEEIRAGVSEFQKGNGYLKKAVDTVKGNE